MTEKIACIVLGLMLTGGGLGFAHELGEVTAQEQPLTTETIYISDEVIGPPVVEQIEEEEAPQGTILTGYEMNLISIIVMAEAEGESELGKRLVIDTILNRMDHECFPDTVMDVIFQKNQFTCVSNGRFDSCYVKPEILGLVQEEAKSRTNSDVIFFRAGRYSSYGTPLFKECCHYFSAY